MIVFKYSQTYIKKLKFKGFQTYVYFCSSFSGCWDIINFWDFSLNKSCKTYVRPPATWCHKKKNQDLARMSFIYWKHVPSVEPNIKQPCTLTICFWCRNFCRKLWTIFFHNFSLMSMSWCSSVTSMTVS